MKYRIMVHNDEGECVSDETHITDGSAVDWLTDVIEGADGTGVPDLTEGSSIEVRVFD